MSAAPEGWGQFVTMSCSRADARFSSYVIHALPSALPPTYQQPNPSYIGTLVGLSTEKVAIIIIIKEII